MSSLYSLSFCVPPPLQQAYELFWCLKSYSFSGGMLDQSPCATGRIGWAMAWGKGLPDGVCGRALWGLQLRSDAVGLLRSSGATLFPRFMQHMNTNLRRSSEAAASRIDGVCERCTLFRGACRGGSA